MVRAHAPPPTPVLDEAHAAFNLGNALRDQGRPTDALHCYQRVIEIDPRLTAAYLNAGNVLRTLKRPGEAQDYYQRALALQPDLADAYNNIGALHKDAGRLDEALACYRRALELNPRSAVAHYNVATVYRDQQRWDDAAAAYDGALALNPALAEAHNNLGLIRKDQGRLSEAIASFSAALKANPRYTGAHSNLLLTLNYMDGVQPETVFRAHRDFGIVQETPFAGRIAPHGNVPDTDRRLRIGYVSPDFRFHACAFFLEPVLASHHHGDFEIFCYAEVERPDTVTGRLHALADHWRDTVGMSDEALAQTIRADGIDILVDLAGHTASNRLPVFARKPAPVQATWLGYPGTSGLTAIDYRISDRHADPQGSDAFYTEKLLRLPDALCCFRPMSGMPDIGPLPASGNGHITFGSFNNFNKLSATCIELWARILCAVPGSRLLMVTVPEGQARSALIDRFASLGVAADRLTLHGKLPSVDFYALFRKTDIAFDPFPMTGGTTTCETLWMAVPVIVRVGDRYRSRLGLSFLTAAGYPEFAVTSNDAYFELAVRLASDIPALADLHAGMRARIAASPLIDAARFARNLESLYRQMWHDWCCSVT